MHLLQPLALWPKYVNINSTKHGADPALAAANDDLDPLKKVVPFRELDTDGKTKRLHERGRDLQLKKRRQEIIACIQENDHILQDVYDFIRTLGVEAI